MTTRHAHDPDSWDFSVFLQAPEYHLHECLRSQWPILYWLMRIGDSALEVGAGSGRGSILLKRLRPDKRVVATDASRVTCDVIREYVRVAGVDVGVECCDALSLPFPDKSFGIAYSVGLLEHYPDDWILAVLREQARVADAVLFQVPLDRYMMNFRSIHGDERALHKMYWLGLVAQVAPIVEMHFYGEMVDEYSLLVILDTR